MTSARPATLLLDAADADGAALRSLRRTVTELTEQRQGPLHIASVVTDLLTGTGDERRLEDALTITNGETLASPPPPGVPVEVTTRAKLVLYGQVLGTHLDPPDLDADGTLPDGAENGRRRVIIDFDAVPAGLELSEQDQVGFDRICRTGRWLTADGHVHVNAADDHLSDTARYARWLAGQDRAEIRTGLPDSTDRLARLLDALVEALAVYESTFVVTGGWIWTRDGLSRRLDETVGAGRLFQECKLIAEQATTVYRDAASGRRAPSKRALAAELSEAAGRWGPDDRRRLTVGPRWAGTLFALTQTIARELPATGASLLESSGGLVHAFSEERFGISGVWRLEPVDDAEADRLRQQARDELDEAERRRADEEITAWSFPFTLRVSDREFRDGIVVLPEDAVERLPADGQVTVRLAFVPSGRFANRPIVAASSGTVGSDRDLPFEWPALIGPGTRLSGTVTRRGRLVELAPATGT